MAPGSSIVTVVPESDCGDDDGLSESLGGIMLDVDSASKPWSTSASLANVALSSLCGLNDLLECPVCTNSMRPPILQCPNGHTICSSCKHRVENHCPTCRQELGNIRCLALEKVAEQLQLPCKYQSTGCTEIHPYKSKLKHEELCRFRPYSCPYAGSECLIAGDVPFLVSHLINDHKVDLHEGCTFNHRYVKPNPYEVENATWMLTVSRMTSSVRA
ncbi:SINA2 [Zea mays]|uniref:RING-type E3 ubiquitin transferase n=1 Tax=Zea mays TaxID=4577 RepID=A0A1D6GZF6_MAIZE|nr:SINA2 [Zea mays]